MLRFLPAFVVPLLALLPGPTDAAPARLLATRSAQTPQGATRVVFETDRPVEYLTVELPSGNGFEIHLIDVDGTSPPAPMKVAPGVIRDVTFRGTATGLVADLDGADTRLIARTFTLADPARVVVDLRPAAGNATRKQATIEPAEPVAVHKAVRGTAGSAPAPVVAANDASNGKKTIFEETSPEDVARSERAVPEAEDFEDLLVWIHALQNSVTALNATDDVTDRARYRRRLAYLLVQRGILVEGERALVSALEGEGRDSTTAVTDSVSLAEIRLSMGDRDAAADVAQHIPADRTTPSDRVRVASVLLDTGHATLAESLLRPTLDRLEGTERARATLLLARAQWEQGHTVPARDTVRQLTSAAATPSSLLPEALLLHADCEFALGRAREAEALYQRAAALPLPDDDASWVGLQLGNLARRDGRSAEARKRWQATADKWPDTFYASQAAWFLRVADRMQKLTEVEAGRG